MLRPQRNAPSLKTPAASVERNRQAPAQFSIWLRLGIPAALACTAGWLNASLVQQQLDPTEAFALKVNVAPGMALKPEFFESIKVGGTLNRKTLLNRSELLSGLGKLAQPARTPAEALQQAPLIFTRFLNPGELLTDACFGDRESLAPDERVIQISMSKISGNCAGLLPGQIIYFDAFSRDSQNKIPTIQEIGPFRVAVSTRIEGQAKNDIFLSLVTRLGPQGQLSTHAELLRLAACTDTLISLALIEKPPFRQNPDPALTSNKFAAIADTP